MSNFEYEKGAFGVCIRLFSDYYLTFSFTTGFGLYVETVSATAPAVVYIPEPEYCLLNREGVAVKLPFLVIGFEKIEAYGMEE